MRTGLPVSDEEKRCSLCMQIIDVFGDHGACCSVSSDRIHRHNRVRNLLDRICHEGMLSPVMEKYRLLGDVYGRRPGDVTIPVWRANKGLAIDVAVTSPTYLAHSLARVTRRRRSTLAMTMISKALRLSLPRWSSRQPVASTMKVSNCCDSCFASQPNTKAFSSVFTAVVRGRVSHAVCNLLFLNVSLIVRGV